MVYSRVQRGRQQLQPQAKKDSTCNKDSRPFYELPSQPLNQLCEKAAIESDREPGEVAFCLRNGLATDVSSSVIKSTNGKEF